MIRIGKYVFLTEQQADDIIALLPEGHTHTIVKRGFELISPAVIDEVTGLEITPAVFGDEFRVDVLWNPVEIDPDTLLPIQPIDWQPYYRDVNGNSTHSFMGLDYEENKF